LFHGFLFLFRFAKHIETSHPCTRCCGFSLLVTVLNARSLSICRFPSSPSSPFAQTLLLFCRICDQLTKMFLSG
jgi:hypothetical protein